MSFEFL